MERSRSRVLPAANRRGPTYRVEESRRQRAQWRAKWSCEEVSDRHIMFRRCSKFNMDLHSARLSGLVKFHLERDPYLFRRPRTDDIMKDFLTYRWEKVTQCLLILILPASIRWIRNFGDTRCHRLLLMYPKSFELRRYGRSRTLHSRKLDLVSWITMTWCIRISAMWWRAWRPTCERRWRREKRTN